MAAPFAVIALAFALGGSLAAALPTSFDRLLSRMFWEQLQRSPDRCNGGTAQPYVEALFAPLEAAVESELEFELLVMRDSAVNAFSLPGGYIVVNLGLLKAAESSEEVAAVLAHEAAHVTLRHGTRRLMRVMGGSLLVSLVYGGADTGVLLSVLGELEHKRHDRSEEVDADAHALRLLERVGISPRGLATFFRRLEAEPQLPELLSTHPDPGARALIAEQAAASATQTTAALPALPKRLSCN